MGSRLADAMMALLQSGNQYRIGAKFVAMSGNVFGISLAIFVRNGNTAKIATKKDVEIVTALADQSDGKKSWS